MAFAPNVELRLSPRHSLTPYTPFHSNLNVNSSLSSNLFNPNERVSLKQSYSEPMTGT
jgi:hypothetical protein